MHGISNPFYASSKFHQSQKQPETPSRCIHPFNSNHSITPLLIPTSQNCPLVRRFCGSSGAGHPIISEISSIDLLVVVLHCSEDPLCDVLEGAALSRLLWELLNCVHCDCFSWVLRVCEEYYWGFVCEFEVMRIDLCVCVVWIWLIAMLWCEDAVMMFWMLNWTLEGRYLSIYPSSLPVKVRGKDDFSKYY
jgi:hypothetical protein